MTRRKWNIYNTHATCVWESWIDLEHCVRNIHDHPLCCSCIAIAVLNTTCLAGMQYICALHTRVTDTQSIQALKHKPAPLHFPIELQITLMSTNSTCTTQSYFHNRWQEAFVASVNNWAAGSCIYYQLCPVSINHLHRAAFWLRCHSRPQCGWHAGKQWSC